MHLILNKMGYNLLSIKETISFLKPYEILFNLENRIYLPNVENCCGNKNTMVFFEREGITVPVYVWLFEHSGKEARQLAHGAVLVKDRLNCTDYNHAGFYYGLLHTNIRKPRQTQILIAPWSQYLDGIVFGGYYDYVFLVLSKLCRIKDALSTTEFSGAMVSYPLFGTPYEKEYLSLLGVSSSNIVDSRYYDVKFKKAVMANSGHWVYPNLLDLFSIKRHIESILRPVKTAGEIRIERQSLPILKYIGGFVKWVMFKKTIFSIDFSSLPCFQLSRSNLLSLHVAAPCCHGDGSLRYYLPASGDQW